MGLLRSEEMGYYELVIHSEMAWRTLNEIGKLSAIQITDLNAEQTVFNRTYASYIRRCEDAERRIRFIVQEQDRFKIPLVTTRYVDEVIDQIDEQLEFTKTPAQTYFANLERELEGYETSLTDQVKQYEQIMTTSNLLDERKLILEKARDNFNVPDQQGEFTLFSRIAGVIERADIERFKRMVFRVTRGNALTVIYDIEEPVYDPKTEKNIEKSVFFILFQGDQEGILSTKLGRICDTLGINKYRVPGDHYQMEKDYSSNLEDIRMNQEMLNRTREMIQSILQKLAATKTNKSLCSIIEEYRLFVLKEKAIYHHLNMFKFSNSMFYGYCWCPRSLTNNVETILQDLGSQPGSIHSQFRDVPFPSGATPPSYFKLNEFTASFQEIVDTYGIPNYQEANPAFFTIVTFPYLFGVMFGDVGHGLILFSFATYLCLYKDQIEKSGGMFAPAVPVRYLLLLMGLFATYNGLIYNDFLGIPFNFFGSKWAEGAGTDQYTSSETYPFGMDPVWYTAKNELIFFNSFKMKISVIFGVTQMIVGILFKGANSIYFRSPLDFIFEFIPQLAFMTCIFGYMIIMIFIKWTTDWNYNWDDTAPNLITVLMNMFLKMGSLDDQNALWGDKEQQESIQLTLLLIGLVCVPLMLFPKPLIKLCLHKSRSSGDFNQFVDEGGHQHEEFDFGEEFIHQMIETIEYVLGAISNTASYLRLWALSLAHAQLSKVFFEKCLVGTIETGNPLMVVVGFFVFANVTVGVLMCMDAMECFLHALRLHWVEFQSKFYKGQGIKFMPFSFQAVAGDGKLK